MTLKLTGLEVSCIIGERPDERLEPQTILVDVAMVCPSRAAVSDNLHDTVDYAALAETIRAKLTAAKCQMIERAAKVVYDLLPTKNASVTITKKGAVPNLASASVVYP